MNDLFSQSLNGNRIIPEQVNKSVLFADDIILDDQPDEDQQNIQVCSAFNGDLYAAYSYFNEEHAWIKILKSVNNGSDWTVVLDGAIYINHSTVTNLNILAAGNSLSELKLFLGFCLYDSVTHYQVVALSRYDTNGVFEDEILQEYLRGIKYIAIASDYMYPATNSNPYSIAAVYSKNNYFDTLVFCSSSDGGFSIDTRLNIAHSTIYFHKVGLAYGRSQSQSSGRYFATWEEQQDKNSSFGHIYTAHSEPDFNSPFTDPVLLDTLDGSTANKASNPAIACQFNAVDNDSLNLTEIILCEKYDSVNENFDVIGYYNKKATNSEVFMAFTLDTTPDNKMQPDISFNLFDSTFMVTYFDSSMQKLPFITNNYNLSDPNS